MGVKHLVCCDSEEEKRRTLVVDVHVGDGDVTGHTLEVNGKAMVVASDFHFSILGLLNGVVGATMAGFLLGFIEMFVPMIFPSTLRDLIAYSIVLLILVFRPHGFFGEAYSAKLRL